MRREPAAMKLAFLVAGALLSGAVAAATPPPTLTFSSSAASAPAASSVTLNWTTSNATRCTAGGDWSGTRLTQGPQDAQVLRTGTNTYTISCSGSGGSTSASVQVSGTASAAQYDGNYVGSYKSTVSSSGATGTVRLNAAGGAVTLFEPCCGTGTVDQSGVVKFSARASGNPIFTFSGHLHIAEPFEASSGAGAWSSRTGRVIDKGHWTAARLDSPLMLNLPGSGTDPDSIDYSSLPVLNGSVAVVSPADANNKYQLHSYLTYFEGLYWCMWSEGPGEDQAGTHVRYATSGDGLNWSPAADITPATSDGYATIARGFWIRNGQFIALVSRFVAPGAFGSNKDLALQDYLWDGTAWSYDRVVAADTVNNYPPLPLPDGSWAMSRRDSASNDYLLLGGVADVATWDSVPVSDCPAADGFRPNEPILWPLDPRDLTMLFRDDGGSLRIFRATSVDGGRTWSVPEATNFPNTTSKIATLLTSSGYRVLVSNASPAAGRRQMMLSISADGRVFTRMAVLSISVGLHETIQYPDILEHDGNLLIAYSRSKNSIEVISIPLAAVDALR